jgi:uncharacterized protein YutE (UPF0331/DUF86 family)
VSPLAERLAELKRHLDHLRALRPRVTGPETLRRDLSLHNDVLFSLLTVCQLVIDISGELAARRGERFEDYAGAVRSLAADTRFLVHEYVALDMARVVKALDRLEPVEEFLEIARTVVEGGPL